MRYIQRFLVFFFALFIIAGCATNTNKETPEAFATRFYSNIEQNNTDELSSMFDLSSLTNSHDLSFAQSKLNHAMAQLSQDFNNKGGINRIEVNQLNMSEDNQNAQMNLTVYFQDGSSTNDHMQIIQTASGWAIR